MKILSAEQIRKADQYTIENEPVSSVELMERAAKKCSDWIVSHYSGKPVKVFKIICGIGNNGGDGLVIARHLAKSGLNVEVFILRLSDKTSDDFAINYKRLKDENVQVTDLTEDNHEFRAKAGEVIVDAIFGSGLSRPIEGFIADITYHVNNSNAEVISIDMPSGLFSEDNSDNIRKNIVQADYTLTFQLPKLSLLFPENAKYSGKWEVLDIGLDKEFIDKTESKYYYLTKEMVKPLIRKRSKYSHKGSYGHALLSGGSYGKMGAIVMAAKACLRSGVGLLTTQIPQCGYEVMQTSVPEGMAIVDPEKNFISEYPVENYDAIGIGPGLGREEASQNLLKLFIQNSKSPLILDADALNILSENKTWLPFFPASCILTPHPGEFRRLVGKWDTDEEKLKFQKDFALKHSLYVILKGAHTSIACPDGEMFFNSTGNPGMATGGSGDVLTGIITALRAGGYDSKQASVLGVYLHGLAGDIAAAEKTMEGMIAGDIIEAIPEAWAELKRKG